MNYFQWKVKTFHTQDSNSFDASIYIEEQGATIEMNTSDAISLKCCVFH